MQSAQEPMGKDVKIIFLHHSTGNCVWRGGVPEWLKAYNSTNGTNYSIAEQAFPKEKPYGWANYPYDYWKIWVENAGDEPYMQEPTLEMLTKDYDVIIFKHCFPVSAVGEDTGEADVSSDRKSIENYKLQYEALKAKLHEFPDTRFIVWTGALLAEDDSDPDSGRRAAEFFKWVTEQWDEPGDNIFIWDFAAVEGEGGLFLKEEYQAGPGDSHPNGDFSKMAAPLFARRIVDVIEGRGDAGSPWDGWRRPMWPCCGKATRPSTRRACPLPNSRRCSPPCDPCGG